MRASVSSHLDHHENIKIREALRMAGLLLFGAEEHSAFGGFVEEEQSSLRFL